jgi:hypothetical protein
VLEELRDMATSDKPLLRRLQEFPAKNPIAWGIMAFIFGSFPQWLQAVFGLFTTEALVPWLRSKGIPVPHLHLIYFTAPIGVLLIWRVFKATMKTENIQTSLDSVQVKLVILATLCAVTPFFQWHPETPVHDDAMRLVASLDGLYNVCATNKLSPAQCIEKFEQRDYERWIVRVHGELFEHNRSSDALDACAMALERGSGYMLFQNTQNSATNIIVGIRNEVYRLASPLSE